MGMKFLRAHLMCIVLHSTSGQASAPFAHFSEQKNDHGYDKHGDKYASINTGAEDVTDGFTAG